MAYLIYLYNRETRQYRYTRFLYYTKREAMRKARLDNPGFVISSVERMNGWL